MGIGLQFDEFKSVVEFELYDKKSKSKISRSKSFANIWDDGL
jgi:hypothetical protein